MSDENLRARAPFIADDFGYVGVPEDVVYSPGVRCAFELKNGKKVSGLLNSLDMSSESDEGAKIGVKNSDEKFYFTSEIAGCVRVFDSEEKNDLVLSLGEMEDVE